MSIIHLKKLFVFARSHADARKSLLAWQYETEQASWSNKHDVLTSFPNAKMIRNNRARFEIKHNTYRLIAQINYDTQMVAIRFIGTHNEYDRIDPETI
jgi:mRNA interferase HigB